MAETGELVTNTPNPNYNVLVDKIGGNDRQQVRLNLGPDGTSTPILAGQQTMAASVPVVIASDQTSLPISVTVSSVTVTNAAGASAVNIQDGGNSITVDGTVAATQSGTWNINNVSGTVSLPTGASTAALQTTGNTSLSSIDGKITACNTGAIAGTVTVQQATSSNLKAQVDGTVAEGGTGNNPVYIGMKDLISGVIRVPHCYQSLGINFQVCLTPDPNLNFVKYTASGESYGFTASTDGTQANTKYIQVDSNRRVETKENRPSSSAVTSVAASASSVSLLASNSNRLQAMFYNDSTSACYLKYGATASTTSFTVKIFPSGYHEIPWPAWTGAVDCIWDSATGNMRITELTI